MRKRIYTWWRSGDKVATPPKQIFVKDFGNTVDSKGYDDAVVHKKIKRKRIKRK